MKNFFQLLLKKKNSLLAFFVLLALGGILSFFSLPREWNNPQNKSQYKITTTYKGANSSQIEKQITNELEKQFFTLHSLTKISSSSQKEQSVVRLEFSSKDKNLKQEIQTALLSSKIPSSATSKIELQTSNNLQVALLGEAEILNGNMEKLTTEILKISEVMGIETLGNLEQEVKILLNPLQLQFYNLHPLEVKDTVQKFTSQFLSGNKVVGEIKLGPLNYALKVAGHSQNLALEQLIIKTEETGNILLQDIAEIKEKQKRNVFSKVAQKPAILLTLSLQESASTKTTIKKIQNILNQHKNIESKILNYKENFIQENFLSIGQNLLVAGLFVALALVMLLSFWKGLTVFFSILLSISLALTLLFLFSIPLDLMIVFGFLLGFPITIKNKLSLLHFFSLSKTKNYPQLLQLVFLEMIPITLIITFVSLCLFLPFFILELEFVSLDSLHFENIFIGFILLYCCSLLVLVFFVPLFYSIRPSQKSLNLALYEKFFEWQKKYSSIILFLTFLIFTSFAVLASKQSFPMLPKTNPSELVIAVILPSGSSIVETSKTIEELEKKALFFQSHFSDLVTVIGDSGNQEDFHQKGSNKGHLKIFFHPTQKKQKAISEIVQEIKNTLKSTKGAEIRFLPKRIFFPSPETQTIWLELEKENWNKSTLEKLRSSLEKIETIQNLQGFSALIQPELLFSFQKENLAAYEMSEAQILEIIQLASEGAWIGEEIGEKITVYFREQENFDLENFLQTPIYFSEESSTYLQNFMRVERVYNLTAIEHQQGKRILSLQAEITPKTSDQEAIQNIEKVLQEQGITDYNINNNQNPIDTKSLLKKQNFSAFKILFFTFLFLSIIILLHPNITTKSVVIILITILFSVIASLGGLWFYSPTDIIFYGLAKVLIVILSIYYSLLMFQLMENSDKKKIHLQKSIAIGCSRAFPLITINTIIIIVFFVVMALGLKTNFYGFSPFITSNFATSTIFFSLAYPISYGLLAIFLFHLFVFPIIYYWLTQFQKK